MTEEFESEKQIREAETSSTSEDEEGRARRVTEHMQPLNRKQIHQFKDQLERDHRDLLAKGKKREAS